MAYDHLGHVPVSLDVRSLQRHVRSARRPSRRRQCCLTARRAIGTTTDMPRRKSGGQKAAATSPKGCIFDGFISNLEARSYNVFAEHDWWGTPSGPPAGTVVESTPGFTINTSQFLQQAPPACAGQ